MSLFSNIKINNLVVPNRFFRSATYEALATRNGSATDDLINLYRSYKKVGLIMSSCTLVDPRGRHHPTMLSLVDSDACKSFSRLSDAVHDEGSAFGVQLAHSGMFSKIQYLNGHQPETPKNMTKNDIERVIHNFGQAARAARDSGADCVQLHCAGPFLLGSFLSHVSNDCRNDEFGSDTVEKRSEFMRQAICEVRKNLPMNFPVLIKLNGCSQPSFINHEDILKICQIAENAGANAIEIAVDRDPKTKLPDYSVVSRVKTNAKVPIISTGCYTVLKEMEEAVKSGRCDMIGLSRPLIRQPGIVGMFYSGKAEKATCKNCNGCLAYTSGQENPLKCILDK
ncbi:NADPH dehydrogenase [Tritrichomonas foetus]|uniref:NADPH dehydrogenase n=1 Tax=Tritrichomonas foetus TaxID=1144522 RepID=A0A1J4KFU4_9EUKA|nr:NADPH dehydrogenase [Tritrichomonas foetus]|eukprot:OHT09808.1 NADPH dehydrogenase [Tritrichomonas foetus]